MKSDTTLRPLPKSPEEIASVISRAPERVDDPDCSYDPNDPEAVARFWKDGIVRQPASE